MRGADAALCQITLTICLHSTLAEMDDRFATIDMGHGLYRESRGELLCLFPWGWWVPICNTVWPKPRPTSVPSGTYLDPSSRLVTMDRKVGWGLLCAFRGEAGSSSTTVSPGPRPTSVLSGILIHQVIWPQYTWAEKWGLRVPFGRGELGPHLKQCGLGQGLPRYQVAS